MIIGLTRRRSHGRRAGERAPLADLTELALDDLVSLLHSHPSDEVRAQAARALGRLGSHRAVDALLASLDEGPVAMRVQVMRALGEIGAPEAVPALHALLVGPSRLMAEPAAAALAAMGDAGLRVLRHVAEGEGHAAAIAASALAARYHLVSVGR